MVVKRKKEMFSGVKIPDESFPTSTLALLPQPLHKGRGSGWGWWVSGLSSPFCLCSSQTTAVSHLMMTALGAQHMLVKLIHTHTHTHTNKWDQIRSDQSLSHV